MDTPPHKKRVGLHPPAESDSSPQMRGSDPTGGCSVPSRAKDIYIRRVMQENPEQISGTLESCRIDHSSSQQIGK